MGVNFFLGKRTNRGGRGVVLRTHIFPSLFSWITPLETLDPGTRDTIWICQKPSDVYIGTSGLDQLCGCLCLSVDFPQTTWFNPTRHCVRGVLWLSLFIVDLDLNFPRRENPNLKQNWCKFDSKSTLFYWSFAKFQKVEKHCQCLPFWIPPAHFIN